MERQQIKKHKARASARRRSRRFSKPGYHHLLNMLLLICAAAGIYGVVTWLSKPSTFMLNRLQVSSNAQYLPVSKLKSQIKKEVNGGFFNYNISALKTSLLENPWIKDVTIRKIFPHQLKVSVVEKKPLAIWNLSGLVDQSGEVFYPSVMPKLDLPQFFGLEADIPSIYQHYLTFQKVFSGIKRSVIKIAVNPQGVWSLTLDNGIKVTLGEEDLMTKCQRFVEAYPELHNPNMKIQSVDLRYADGFAVKWVVKNKKLQKNLKLSLK